MDSLNQSLKYQSTVISTVDFSPSIVCSYLDSLDVSKACGPDLIPAFLLRCCAEEISSPLSYLFNESMSTGIHFLGIGLVLMSFQFTSAMTDMFPVIIGLLALQQLLLRL